MMSTTAQRQTRSQFLLELILAKDVASIKINGLETKKDLNLRSYRYLGLFNIASNRPFHDHCFSFSTNIGYSHPSNNDISLTDINGRHHGEIVQIAVSAQLFQTGRCRSTSRRGVPSLSVQWWMYHASDTIF